MALYETERNPKQSLKTMKKLGGNEMNVSKVQSSVDLADFFFVPLDPQGASSRSLATATVAFPKLNRAVGDSELLDVCGSLATSLSSVGCKTLGLTTTLLYAVSNLANHLSLLSPPPP